MISMTCITSLNWSYLLLNDEMRSIQSDFKSKKKYFQDSDIDLLYNLNEQAPSIEWPISH